ncbi:Cof-type HAD-IIB family hydrolase [Candidatus Woesearchaeota archaeon]|nr:Cof-type HAD-IIB family hydrolase [Candidatus Woesearchaeota archaeon]
MQNKIKDIVEELNIALDRNIKLTFDALKPTMVRQIVSDLDNIVSDIKEKTHEHAFKNVEAIFFDLDGTLVLRDKTSRKCLKLIEQLMKKGIIVGIASGRARDSLNSPVFQFAKKFNGPLIFEDGSLILTKGSLDLSWDKKIKPAQRYLKQIADKYSHYDIRWKERSFSVYSATKDLPDIVTLRNVIVNKNRGHHNVVPGIAGKGNAIRYACKKLKIPMKYVCCIGNDINDIPMFNVAGFPCAVSNAFNKVKHYVRHKGGFVTRYPASLGCTEIMKKIL